jgi:hypothetical protein
MRWARNGAHGGWIMREIGSARSVGAIGTRAVLTLASCAKTEHAVPGKQEVASRVPRQFGGIRDDIFLFI